VYATCQDASTTINRQVTREDMAKDSHDYQRERDNCKYLITLDLLQMHHKQYSMNGVTVLYCHSP